MWFPPRGLESCLSTMSGNLVTEVEKFQWSGSVHTLKSLVNQNTSSLNDKFSNDDMSKLRL